VRIIGGSIKRRSIKSPSSAQGVRPILGRIKKSLFDILTLRLPDCRFLDLYAGSGAVGIEALSRGASLVTFVDNNPHCLSIIRQNLSHLGLLDKARLVKMDATKSLEATGGPFDLIFMGPPYHDQSWRALSLTQPTLQAIDRAHVLKEDGWVIGQHHAKEPEVQGVSLKMFRQQSYGDTRLSFFHYERPQ
jgi:16S rRNA (guanine(966)-N(2))-methyltransferase RsmD